MATFAGNFFPPEYKTFPFKEGDLLASRRSGGKYSINKVLKVDKIFLKKGAAINIQGQSFIATEDDYLLVISCSYGASEFNSIDDARAAAASGKWTVHLAHAPNRSPGAAVDKVHIGHAPVQAQELNGYTVWRKNFDQGKAGIF